MRSLTFQNGIVVPVPTQSPTLKAEAVTDQTGVVTVYYDGSCPLCAAEIGLYRRCTGADALAFVDVSAQEPGAISTGLDRTTALKRFHVRDAGGTLVAGAEAFGELWLALPAWRWRGRIVLLPGVLQATELVYRCFLFVRPAMQGLYRVTAATMARS